MSQIQSYHRSSLYSPAPATRAAQAAPRQPGWQTRNHSFSGYWNILCAALAQLTTKASQPMNQTVRAGESRSRKRESPHSILNTPMNKSTISDTPVETISVLEMNAYTRPPGISAFGKNGPKMERPVTRKWSGSCVQGQAEAGSSQKAKVCKR